MCLYIRLNNVFCDAYIRHTVVCVSLLWHRGISCSSCRCVWIGSCCCGKREASDGTAAMAYGEAKGINYEKLFIGELLVTVTKEKLSGIMLAQGCEPCEIHLVPGLSLFRMMSCLFFYCCFPFCLLV